MIPTYIIVHDSDSPYGNPWAVETWHRKRWGARVLEQSGTEIACGYHYLILNGFAYSSRTYDEFSDGEIIAARPEWLEGAHCTAQGMNHKSLGVCLIGPDASGAFSDRQKANLFTLLRHLMAVHHLSVANVLGHKEVDPDNKRDPRLDMEKLRAALTM